MTHFRPADETELVRAVQAALGAEETLEIVAGGSKRALGRPSQAMHVLELGAFSGIRDYEPAELVITAGAATPLAEIEAALAASHQMLAFEPGDWRVLLGSLDSEPTLGGALACNLSGSRRIRQGAARDHFLGFRGVSGRGEAFKAGGRMVKNVTGYDLCKLMAGSYGTLAALTEVTVKVLPQPDATRTVVLAGLEDGAALRAMTQALNASHEVSGAAHVPAALSPDHRAVTAMRVEGPLPSVEARAPALCRDLGDFGPAEILGDSDSLAFWRDLRDVKPFATLADAAVWRVSIAPSVAPAVIVALKALDCRYFLDWGGGLLWLAVRGAADGGAAAIRAALPGGHATLIRGSEALRVAVPVFQPQAPAVAALSARIKESFDPRHILNRGRMYVEL